MSFWDKLFNVKKNKKNNNDKIDVLFFPIKDQNNKICGLWVRYKEDAKKKITITTWLMMLEASEEIQLEAMNGNYRVVPNKYDKSGGFYVMVGSVPAPGE
ncbi:MAG: hypothetical protein K8S23_11960 [Candidatus Cloacimonetes bacterium]|nr:hypothetical protein [Candidatus Cloacimonadota bacterium]